MAMNHTDRTSTVQDLAQRLFRIPQQVLRYLSEGGLRIFRPADDDYPNTGIQPFEGELPKRKQRHPS